MDEAFRRVATYHITKASGELGPKRKEGDRQVPEGCYVIEAFNPKSEYHLSLRLNYPNDSDRILSDPQRPGGDIYIHGGAKSIGCIPLGDAVIEELYLLALDARRRGQERIAVHIFPARMQGPEWETLLRSQDAERRAFWEQLQPIQAAFERERLVPEVAVDARGGYQLVR